MSRRPFVWVEVGVVGVHQLLIVLAKEMAQRVGTGLFLCSLEGGENLVNASRWAEGVLEDQLTLHVGLTKVKRPLSLDENVIREDDGFPIFFIKPRKPIQ